MPVLSFYWSPQAVASIVIRVLWIPFSLYHLLLHFHITDHVWRKGTGSLLSVTVLIVIISDEKALCWSFTCLQVRWTLWVPVTSGGICLFWQLMTGGIIPLSSIWSTDWNTIAQPTRNLPPLKFHLRFHSICKYCF